MQLSIAERLLPFEPILHYGPIDPSPTAFVQSPQLSPVTMKVIAGDNTDLVNSIFGTVFENTVFENIDVVDISGATATVIMPLVAAEKLNADLLVRLHLVFRLLILRYLEVCI